jgi:hypothetical protein
MRKVLFTGKVRNHVEVVQANTEFISAIVGVLEATHAAVTASLSDTADTSDRVNVVIARYADARIAMEKRPKLQTLIQDKLESVMNKHSLGLSLFNTARASWRRIQ